VGVELFGGWGWLVDGALWQCRAGDCCGARWLMLNCARHSTVRMLVYREDAQEEGAMGREALVVWREVSLIQREEAVAHREEVTKEDAVRVREELVEERARGLEDVF